tara:strand:+ start:190 stop:453 length:264 start_codon:yes stop_codon:yes gene_type:complete
MKIYVVTLDMSLVLTRLKKFNLHEFNYKFPKVFIEAQDPDDACYKTMCKLSEIMLQQQSSVDTAVLIRSVQHDIRIVKAICKDEKKL